MFKHISYKSKLSIPADHFTNVPSEIQVVSFYENPLAEI